MHHITAASTEEVDDRIEETRTVGQGIIDSLTLIQCISPHFDPKLWPRLGSLFPLILSALRSRFSALREAAALCFATLCSVLTTEAMRYVIEYVVPLLG